MSLSKEKIIEVLKACPQEDHTQDGWIWRQRIAWARAIESAVLAELKKAEPVAFIQKRSNRNGTFVRKLVWNSTPEADYPWCVGYTPLYAAPVVQPCDRNCHEHQNAECPGSDGPCIMQQSPVVPDGMVLVPREPTEKMLEAASNADREYTDRCFGKGFALQQLDGYDHYVLMIAAAQEEVK